MTETVTVELDEARSEKLRWAAQRTGADANAVLGEALDIYTAALEQAQPSLSLTDEDRTAIEAGLDDVRQGRVSSHEDVFTQLRAKYGT